MSRIIKHNELHPRYESWTKYWFAIKDKLAPEALNISHIEHDSNIEYRTTVDFIKARCYEELIGGINKMDFYNDGYCNFVARQLETLTNLDIESNNN